MRLVGKVKSEDIEFVKTVMRLSGAREREFVGAAVLYYSDFLMNRAHELRQEETQAILERQEQADIKSEEQPNDSGTGNINGNSEESVSHETPDSSALAQS